MKFKIPLNDEIELSARLEKARGKRRGYAVLAHCFTCSKDLKSIVRVAKGLREEGYGVLRLDFMGLGESGGDFGESTFGDDVEALVAASRWLEEHREGPRLMVGHSMGGAAALVATNRVESVRAVATIAAPADPYEVTRHFPGQLDEIWEKGRAVVTLAGRQFVITREFLESLQEQDIARAVGELGRPVMFVHSPDDRTLDFEHGLRLFEAARSQRSFITLDGADHLMMKPGYGEYVGRLIGVWASRF